MAVTMQQVRAALDPDEPRYGEASRLGPESLPHLQDLVSGSAGTGLAAKAAYLASLVEGADAVQVVTDAAASTDPIVRAAAAGALQNLSAADQVSVARTLLDDDDSGVRKTALASLAASPRDLSASPLLELVDQVRQRDNQPYLRELAERTALRMRNG
jgi:HEAT repeat protein